jgi:Domain of unknown function (DUF4340)
MSFKTTYILFGALGAMLLVFALILFFGPASVPDSSYVLPGAHDKAQGEVEAKDIDTVTIEPAEGQKIVIAREGEGANRRWRMKEPLTAAVDRLAVDNLVRDILNARKVEAADVNNNLAEWGLATPRRVITLEGKGRTFRLNLGDKSPGKDSAVVYVTSSDYPKNVMAVRLSEVNAASESGVNDLRSRDLLAESESDIGYVRLKPNKGDAVVLESEGHNRWRFVEPKYGAADYEGQTGAAADKAPTGVRPLLSALTAIRVEEKTETTDDKDKTKKGKKDSGFVANNADEKALEKYGLKSAETADLVLSVKRTPSTKQETTLLIGKKADDKGEQFYARLANNHNVVKVSATSLEPVRKFLANPAEARDRDLVHLEDSADVIRIKYPSGEEATLIRSAAAPPSPHGGPAAGGPWTLYLGNAKKGLAANGIAVNNLLTSLTARRNVKDFPRGKTDAELGLKDPNVIVSLWVNGVKPKKEEKKETKKDDKKDEKKKEDKKDEKKEEKKKDEGDRPELKSETPDVVLEFGRVDPEKLVAVRRKTGKDLKNTAVVKVEEKVLDFARADALSYLEQNLPRLFISAGDNVLTRVVVDLGGKVTEVARKDPKNPSSGWVFKKPSDLAGRKADTNKVRNQFYYGMNVLHVGRWMSLEPSDADLARWGLKAPSGKVTVTASIDGKEKEVSLLLGKQTDQKDYYARRSDLDSVFTLSQAQVDSFKEPLIEMQVLDFKTADVKSVKLTGWPRFGTPATLELERKSGSVWEVKKNPANLKVASERVTALLDALHNLKAEKFIVFGSGPKAEHGMAHDKGGVEIEMTLDNKDKITLTLGKAEGANFYATTNKLKGDVFLIGKGPGAVLEKVKKDPDYLVVSKK